MSSNQATAKSNNQTQQVVGIIQSSGGESGTMIATQEAQSRASLAQTFGKSKTGDSTAMGKSAVATHGTGAMATSGRQTKVSNGVDGQRRSQNFDDSSRVNLSSVRGQDEIPDDRTFDEKLKRNNQHATRAAREGGTIIAGGDGIGDRDEEQNMSYSRLESAKSGSYNTGTRHPQRHAHMDASELQALEFAMLDRSRMSQGQKTTAPAGHGSRQKHNSVGDDLEHLASRVAASDKQGAPPSRLLFSQSGHGSPHQTHGVQDVHANTTGKQSDQQMQLHQMMTASLGTTAVHNVLHTPGGAQGNASLSAHPAGSGYKRTHANGRDRGSLPPPVTGKQRTKKKKMHSALQDALQNASGYHQIVQGAQAPKKGKQTQRPGGSIAQAGHYASVASAHNSGHMVLQNNLAHTPHQSANMSMGGQQYSAQTAGTSGQGANGGHGRRRLLQDPSANKVSQQRLNPAGGLQSMTVIHSKRASASNQPSNNGGKPRGQAGNPSGVPLPTNSQTLVYFNQIREAAERGIPVGPNSLGAQAHGGKGGHKRRNERVAIDTFNITGERGNSLFKQPSETRNSAGRTNEDITEKKDLSKIFEVEHSSAPQTLAAKGGGHLFHETSGSGQIHSLLANGAASNGFPGAAQTVGPLGQGTDPAGLFLPDISSKQSKSGMSHGQFINQTQSAQSTGKKYVHRGSNSFSGMNATEAQSNLQPNTNNLMRDSNSTNAVKQVLSEQGVVQNIATHSGDNTRQGNAIMSGSFHSRTQQSADIKIGNSLQATPQLRRDPPAYINSNAATTAKQPTPSVDMNSYPGGAHNAGATPSCAPVQQVAISEDLRRRTTGSLFQTPQSQTHALTTAMPKSNASRPRIQQDNKYEPREPSDVLSLSTGQAQVIQPPVHLSKHVKNIVQPIQSANETHESGFGHHAENEAAMLEQHSTPIPNKKLQTAQRVHIVDGQPDSHSITDPPSAMQQDRGGAPAAADGQTISRDNSVFFDSVMQRMNPRAGQKRGIDILASSKNKNKQVRQKKEGTSVRRPTDVKRTPKPDQRLEPNMRTPKQPGPQSMALTQVLNAQVAQPEEPHLGGTTPAGDILSGLNSLLSSQPRPFDKAKEQVGDIEESKDDLDHRQPLDVNFGNDSDSPRQHADFDEEDEDEDEDEPDDDEELLESMAENFNDTQNPGGTQQSYRSFGLNLQQPHEPSASGPPKRYQKHNETGQILPAHFNNQASADYYQQVSQQVNSSGPAGGVAQPKGRKKGKRHRRLNTHHHYHIDLNFEQVNNILVSYGGVGHQQTFKNNIKKDASKANVSMSVGGGGNQQYSNFQRSSNTQAQQSQTQAAGTPGHSSMQSRQFNSGPAASPLKRQAQAPPAQGQPPNPLQLPELIINKNKINFGAKQFKMQSDAVPTSPHHEATQAAAMRTSGKSKVEANGFVNYGQNQSRTTANQQRSKRQRTQPAAMESNKKKASVLNATQIIDESISNAFASNKKDKSISQKVSLAQKMNQTAQNIVTSHQNVQQSQTQATPQGRQQFRPDAIQTRPGGAPMNELDMEKSRVSQGSYQDKGGQISGVAERRADSPDKTRGEVQAAIRGRMNCAQWHSAQRQGEPSEAKKLFDAMDERQTTQQIFGLKQQATGGDGRQGHGKPGLSQKAVIPAGAGGPSQSRFRGKAPLHVMTMNKPSGGGLGGAIETPKRHFNVKGPQNKGKVRMTVMEHHSAGLRPPQKPGFDPESEYGQNAVTPGANEHGKQGAGKNFNTLSQISSVVSNSEQSNAPNAGGRTGASKPAANSAYKGPKGARHTMKDQASKLRAIDEQYEKTNQMIEHLSHLNTATKFDLDAEDGAGSPTRIARAKKVRPKITDFDVLGVVGVGNFGRVHKAINTKTNRTVALKVLVKEGVAEMKHVDHVINEREVLQYVSDINVLPPESEDKKFMGSVSRIHEDQSDEEDDRPAVACPFLMSIYSSFQDKENLYFELEYVEGCTLLSQIRSYNQAVMQNMPYYTAEVLMTLEYLHDHCVIYRDLKPENIVISMAERGHLKLVDFGFAKRLQNIKQKTYTNCGTPAYIAPEVLRNANGHGYEADIWSLGVLMIEITSGQTPFQGESTQEVYENVNKCQPQYSKMIPGALRDLCNKIFVGDPDVRIGLSQIKKHPVFAEYDFSVSMRDRHASLGPFIPTEAAFNERADRDSEQMAEVKPKNILAAIMGVPTGNNEDIKKLRMSFDEAHYDKFERERRKDDDLEEQTAGRRKRHNPLGDFKFRRINELF